MERKSLISQRKGVNESVQRETVELQVSSKCHTWSYFMEGERREVAKHCMANVNI